jgi:spore photoproduct lyase
MVIDTLQYRDGKKKFQVIQKQGNAMGTCATFNRKYLCCNTHVLKSVHNCPFDCSYCFLQNYLNDGITKVIGNSEALMEEIRENIKRQPWKLFRIGTWELGDSLALERETGQAGQLIQGFSELKNALLELKTKSDCVDSILPLEHNGRTVISWSLNTEAMILAEEHGTSSLQRRLNAMQSAVKAGYLIGIHFDPMILYDGWEQGYQILAQQVFGAVKPGRIAWISIGSLRFNPEMKKKIENNYPDSRLTCAEMVLGDDLKVRYVKPLRVKMYKLLYSAVRKYLRRENLIYLCMERWDVWEKVFGYRPHSIAHLEYIFAQSLYERYGITEKPPDRDRYEQEIR